MTALPKTASQIPALSPAMPMRMHRLAMQGYKRYFDGERGLSKEDLEELRDGLIQLANEPMAMWDAISGLGLLAVLLEQEGDAETGEAIRSLIASGGQHLAPIAGVLSKALGIQPVNPDGPDRQAMAQVMATGGELRAAHHDAPRPAGTLPLYSVDFAMVTARFRELRLPQGAGWRARFPGSST